MIVKPNSILIPFNIEATNELLKTEYGFHNDEILKISQQERNKHLKKMEEALRKRRLACQLCGVARSKTERSHSVPKSSLLTIAEPGKGTDKIVYSYDYSGSIRSDNPTIHARKRRISEAGTFYLICKKCEQYFSQVYENSAKLGFSQDELMAISQKILLHDIYHDIRSFGVTSNLFNDSLKITNETVDASYDADSISAYEVTMKNLMNGPTMRNLKKEYWEGIATQNALKKLPDRSLFLIYHGVGTLSSINIHAQITLYLEDPDSRIFVNCINRGEKSYLQVWSTLEDNHADVADVIDRLHSLSADSYFFKPSFYEKNQEMIEMSRFGYQSRIISQHLKELGHDF